MPTKIEGCFTIQFDFHEDERGKFIKTFNRDHLANSALDHFQLEEEYYSSSNKNVFRGFHFQIPPHDHNKFIYCISGRVIDFFIDIRKEGSSYGAIDFINLGSDSGLNNAIFLPKGIAHGFFAEADNSTLVYKTDSKYHPESDSGFNIDYFKSQLNIKNPIISQRDKNLINFSEFVSPF